MFKDYFKPHPHIRSDRLVALAGMIIRKYKLNMEAGGMKGNFRNHNRRSIRVEVYDYSNPGDYFITVCTHKRECLFGDITNGEMVLNHAGRIVVQEWK